MGPVPRARACSVRMRSSRAVITSSAAAAATFWQGRAEPASRRSARHRTVWVWASRQRAARRLPRARRGRPASDLPERILHTHAARSWRSAAVGVAAGCVLARSMWSKASCLVERKKSFDLRTYTAEPALTDSTSSRCTLRENWSKGCSPVLEASMSWRAVSLLSLSWVYKTRGQLLSRRRVPTPPRVDRTCKRPLDSDRTPKPHAMIRRHILSSVQFLFLVVVKDVVVNGKERVVHVWSELRVLSVATSAGSRSLIAQCYR